MALPFYLLMKEGENQILLLTNDAICSNAIRSTWHQLNIDSIAFENGRHQLASPSYFTRANTDSSILHPIEDVGPITIFVQQPKEST